MNFNIKQTTFLPSIFYYVKLSSYIIHFLSISSFFSFYLIFNIIVQSIILLLLGM